MNYIYKCALVPVTIPAGTTVLVNSEGSIQRARCLDFLFSIYYDDSKDTI